MTLEVVKEYEKVLVKVERKEQFYNYSLLMYEAQEYGKCLNYLNEFAVSLMEGSDNNDIVSVKLFKDFLDWSVHHKVDREHLLKYEAYKK